MATSSISSADAEQTPERRLALEQIPLVWARALDTSAAPLLFDLLADDVVVDLTPATRRIGLEFPVLSGRSTVVPTLISAVGPLDTMHIVSNVTTSRDGHGYRVDAYALAQHYLPGEGPNPLAMRHALMGNKWTFHAREEHGSVVVHRFLMDCLWFEGDPTVLLAG